MSEYKALKKILENASSLVVFTGAGISVPSGIPDFRSADGLYSQKTNTKYSPEEMISHSFYEEHKEEFFEFYKEKMCFPNAQPNIAHKYIADLERKGVNVTVVTQNIDGLHSKAGSSRVYELHGNVLRNYCEKCARMFGLEYVLKSKGVPTCDKCGGTVKPDVVLYEETLDEDIINRSIAAIMNCDVLLIIGTSLAVYPAAGFIRYFRGKYLVIINKGESAYTSSADLFFDEDIVEVVKKIK